MDSQEMTNNATVPTLGRGGNTVKQSVPLSPGFQTRPQVAPTGFPRYPVNNGLIGASRPVGQQPQQPIHRLESRSSVGQPAPSQFTQPRAYGPPPRPVGNSVPHLRQVQPRQNPTQNLPSPQNPRFQNPPGIRVPNPQIGRPPAPQQLLGPRPINQIQQNQRSFVDQRTQQRNLDLPVSPNAHQSQAQGFSSPRPLPNSVSPRPRNDPPVNTPRPTELSNKDNKQPVRPRIIIDKMPDVDEEKTDLVRESSIQKKKADVRDGGENDDDDDDVVMDNEKTLKQNGSAISDSEKSPRPSDNLTPSKDKSPQRNGNVDRNDDLLSNSSTKSPQTPRKSEDASKSITRPGTATIDTKSEAQPSEQAIAAKNDDKQSEKDASSRSSSAKSEEKTIKTDSIDDRPVSAKSDKIDAVKDEEKHGSVPSSRPASSKVDSKMEEKEDGRSSVEEIKTNGKKEDKTEGDSKEEKIEKNQIKEVSTTDDRAKSPASPAIHSAGQNDAKSSTELGNDVAEEKGKCPASPSNNLTVQSAEQAPKTPSKSPSPDLIKDEKPRGPPSASNVVTAPRPEKAPQTPPKSPSLDVVKEEKPKPSNEPTAETLEQKPQTPAESPSPDLVMEDKRKLSASPSNGLTVQNLEQESKSPSKSSDGSRASTPTVVDAQPDNKLDSLQTEKPSRPASSMSKDSSSEKQEVPVAPSRSPSSESHDKLNVPGSLPTPPKSPQESVKGFDNGQRRSLSSPGSPKSPKSAISTKPTEGEKKKTTFAEDSIIKKDENAEEKAEAGSRESSKPTTPTGKPRRAQTPVKLQSEKREKEAENDSVANESAQNNALPTTNGVADSPTKKSPSKSRESDKRSTAGSPTKSPSKSVKSLPRTPETPSSTGSQDKKKLPMNKIQVGAAPSPNLKTVRSKIGSLENASYKPGGGKVKIENRKLDFSKAQPKIAAKNEKYTPSGGDKKISQMKLQWNAKPKVGSLENATYKPGGGDKKIETVKLDFKDKAKPKVGSKDNAKHVPGGGSVKIQTQKVEIKAESKVGSLDNVKHKPGGGDKKIFNDKDYLRQTGSNVESLCGSGSQSPVPSGAITDGKNGLPTSDENLNQEC
ncbi:hypothetical protein KPH14_006372 [Odynerus spinipes]|uniref:Microtubule-associated protein n=1 Tax=Odynerus spinipes TaxID=1348599 RepID=A0AAD9VVK6_9HYME|nr:hypothetical protein KPH14_006372 [Odynerus spinipes]